MNKIINFLIICSLVLTSFTLSAQQITYPTKNINGKEFYIYTVQQGEGLFSISRRFAVTQSEINNLNPEIHNGLKAGQKILVPVVKTDFKSSENTVETNKTITTSEKRTIQTTDNQEFITHVVKKRQTLFAISRKYSVSQEDIIKANPELANGLKTDMVIRIPQKSTNNPDAKNNHQKLDKSTTSTDSVHFIIHKIKSKETLYSIGRMYGVSVDEIKKHNPITENYLRFGTNLKIPVKIEKSDENIIVKTDTISGNTLVTNNEVLISTHVKTNKKPVRIAFLLPLMAENGKTDAATDRFIDFYAGALIAIQQAKTNGVNLEILTLDVEKSDEKIIETLQFNNDLSKMDFIIGPAYSNQVPYVTEFAKKNKIHTLIPFSSKVNDINHNPYVLQFNPGLETEVAFVADYLARKHKNDNIIFAELQGINFLDDGNEFSVALRNQLDINQITYKRVSFRTDTALPLSDLKKGNKNILIFNTDKYSNVSHYLPLVKAFDQDSEYVIYEQYSWHSHNIDNFNTFTVSPFKRPANNGEINQYKKMFDDTFNWSAKTENPSFDLLGYDLTSYFIAALYYKGADFIKNNDMELPEAEGIQSEIRFIRNDKNSGFINKKLYLTEKK
ncbi:MAG: LysM peptidoglycan-binding domain-containing protein [Paludibacteraceae bacterium]|nr:LysM peptidoglycan-binding domain-containing protein [Paludibacteraceae bacterium]